MNIQQAKAIPLIDLLYSMGYEPSHTTSGGNEVWYCSPLRQEKTPSFTVKVSDNCWKDFGGGGGNILDFVMQHEHTNLRGALSFLHNKFSSIVPATAVVRKVRKENGDNTIILDKIQPLQYRVLLEQLQEKYIGSSVAKMYLKEAYYTNGGKRYFAYCMENDRGGYELKNKYFKGATGGKGLTTIKGADSSRVTIFEGMTDFLSALEYYTILGFQTDVIVLHSLSFLPSVIENIKATGKYKIAYMYLDNDEEGKKALTEFTKEVEGITRVKPMNEFYQEHKDVNEFWVILNQSKNQPIA